MKRRRGQFEQAFDVIDVVVNKKNCRQSDVMRAANLDTNKARKFIKLFVEKGLFAIKDPEPRVTYIITTFGREVYKNMQDIFELIGSKNK